MGELSKLLARSRADADASAIAEAKKAPDVQEIAKLNRILKVLLDFAKDLNEARSVDDVLQRIMEIVFDHVPADRGFLMLRDEDGGDRLTPMVVKHRAAGGDQGKITISKTIADRVLKDRVSILTSDAQVDPRFGAGDSIRFHGIRSAMCAPLWSKDADHRDHPRGLADADQLLHAERSRPADGARATTRRSRSSGRGSTRRSWPRRRSASGWAASSRRR